MNTKIAAHASKQEQSLDDLDALTQLLSQNDLEFSKLLQEARQDFAPLANTDDGRPSLTSLRLAAGLTQTELAQKIGQKQSNVSQMEAGLRPNVQRETMKKMCAALGCDMNTLDAALDATEQSYQSVVKAQDEARRTSRSSARVKVA